jgi:hypothetical protein
VEIVGTVKVSCHGVVVVKEGGLTAVPLG